MFFASFVVDLYLPDNMMAKMFENILIPHISGMISIQRLRKFRDIVEVTLIAERKY